MKSLLLLIIISTTSLYADRIRVGTDVDILKHEMAKAKYTGGDERAFIYNTSDGLIYSTSWSVGQGTLSANFDKKTRKITSLSYSLFGDPEDPIRNSFLMNIEWFDSENGKMLINLKNSEQAGTVQPATRSESKSKGGEKPQPEAEGRSR